MILNIQLEALFVVCSLQLRWQSMCTPKSFATVTGLTSVPKSITGDRVAGKVQISCRKAKNEMGVLFYQGRGAENFYDTKLIFL